MRENILYHRIKYQISLSGERPYVIAMGWVGYAAWDLPEQVRWMAHTRYPNFLPGVRHLSALL